MIDSENLLLLREKFLNHLKDQKCSTSTILAYGKDIEQLITFLGKQNIQTPKEIAGNQITDFTADLANEGYTPKTISRKLNAVKTFFRYLAANKIIEADPSTQVSAPKYEVKPPRILSQMEYRALRDACREDVRISTIVELMLQTGIRIGEVARLTLEDIMDNEMKISSYESQPERIVPLNRMAKEALNKYLALRPKAKTNIVFVTKTGHPMLVRNIRAAIDRYFRIAGIKSAKVNDLRHTWLSHHLAAGTDLVFLSKIAGHKRLSTTEKYLTYVSEKESKEKQKLAEL